MEAPRGQTVLDVLNQLLGDQTGEDSEDVTPLALSKQDMAARILRECSNFHKTRPYIRPGVDISGFTKHFCSSKKYQDIAYGWSLSFNRNFFAELCYDGWLSICSYPSGAAYVLMPWIDPERCVMDYRNIHISKKVVKRSKRYVLSVNKAFDQVVRKCIEQHGESWLYKPMVRLLKGLNRDGYPSVSSSSSSSSSPSTSSSWNNEGNARKQQHSASFKFGVHSIEMWDVSAASGDDEKKVLVAGDIGYTVGGCYTSMTGFRAPGTAGAGTAQLVATGALLRNLGFSFWDLGMVLKYKTELGGVTHSREDFIKRFHSVRDDSKVKLELSTFTPVQPLIRGLRDYQKALRATTTSCNNRTQQPISDPKSKNSNSSSSSSSNSVKTTISSSCSNGGGTATVEWPNKMEKEKAKNVIKVGEISMETKRC